MLTAIADLLPSKPRRGYELPRRLIGLLRCVLQGRARRSAVLPDDLRRDVGVAETLPADRADVFWQTRQGSRMRDLPF
ncbi:hypothetical protein [Neorhizobium sp. JUb45]|uniref:hypothetical protein n=1 Tax=Neorhizobium sp. JUb45 TaxID=2485113 RepID=UPI001046E330|nr:hypothetical protein [Neorhizobium sp. JUb45]TCR06705.1 hypothetical protein EDF70_101666 [Neorhizobium sp. JUb45]